MLIKYILSFKSTHDAFKTQHALDIHKLSYLVIPTPVEISANCGISLYIEHTPIERVQSILKDVSDITYVKAKKIDSRIVVEYQKD